MYCVIILKLNKGEEILFHKYILQVWKTVKTLATELKVVMGPANFLFVISHITKGAFSGWIIVNCIKMSNSLLLSV